MHWIDTTAFTRTLNSRLSVNDALILGSVVAAGGLFALEFDVFENLDHMTSRERRISIQEIFALTGLFIIGLIVFAFRRLQQQKREFARRLVAERAAHAAHREAMSDALTGLANRRALMRAIAGALKGSSDSAVLHALLLIDLTGFKAINDRFGHPVGDRLLEQIGQRLQSLAGGDTVVARMGGDEFAIFCRRIGDRGDAARLADQLIAGINRPIEIDGVSHRVGAGAGVALFPHDASTQQELIARADAALYRAKGERKPAVRLLAS